MKIKIIFIFTLIFIVVAGCRKLSEPVEVIAPTKTPTLTPLPAAQITQTAAALQTAGLSTQQTATAVSAAQTATAASTAVATMGTSVKNPIDAWGSYGNAHPYFQSIAFDAGGNIYLSCDGFPNEILKYDPLGTYLAGWGSGGSGDGQFGSYARTAIDSGGNIYACDPGNYRIQKFNSSGAYVTQWGSMGSGDGQFGTNYNMTGIALGIGNDVYVIDNSNNRVQRFSSSGAYIGQWPVSNPYGIAADNAGNIYVSGYIYIQKFDPAGALITQWGGNGTGNGEFSGGPIRIASDAGDNIYAIDSGNNRVQKFDSTGAYLAQWGSYGTGNGMFNFSFFDFDIAVDGVGDVYVLDYNSRLQKFDSNGVYLSMGFFCRGQFNSPAGIAIDSGNNVYVTDTGNNRIEKFSSTGAYLAQWESSDTGSAQYYFFYFGGGGGGIAVDGGNNVYVSEAGNNRIRKYDSSGAYITQWGSAGSGDGQFNGPFGVAVDSSYNVYAVDRGNHRIQKFSSSGAYITQWGGTGSGNGQFIYPGGVAVDAGGNVYVVDTGNYRIQKFTAAGVYLAQWNIGVRQYDIAEWIAVDNAGNVYVSNRNTLDYGSNRVQKFSSGGILLEQWGGFGAASGQFQFPAGVAADSSGNIYVVDVENNRIQKFAP